MLNTRRQIIFDTIEDLVEILLNSGRKEDEDLPRGSIEEAVVAGEISANEMVDHFSHVLRDNL